MTSPHGTDGEGQVTVAVPPGIDEAFLEDLHRLESVLTAAGSPLPQLLTPGLAPDEVRERLAEIGMQAPSQLLTWWSWHNGLQPGAEGRIIGWEPMSLDAAIQRWHFDMRIFPRGAVIEDDPDYGAWRPTWLPMLDSGGMAHFAADCSPGQAAGCRVVMVSPDNGLFDDPHATGHHWTLRDAVQWWTKLIDGGWYFIPKNSKFKAWDINTTLAAPASETDPTTFDPRWNLF